MSAKHIDIVFTGDGARRYGGRWNHKGTPMVYTAGSISLTALELLVHLQESKLLETYMCIPAEFDYSLCVRIDPESLPSDWNSQPAPYSTNEIGSAWATGLRSGILIVPSVVVPSEYNFLINPLHQDFRKIAIGKPREFQYDPGLMR